MGSKENIDLREKFSRILEKADGLGLTVEQLSSLESIKSLKVSKKSVYDRLCIGCEWVNRHSLALSGIMILLLAIFIGISAADWPVSKRSITEIWYDWYHMDINQEPCLVQNREGLIDYLRPPVDCQICHGVDEIEHVSKINPGEFESKYAYSGRPVVITDGTDTWSAIEQFNYDFFKNIYSEDSPVLMGGEDNCQFFPYKTKFSSVAEVFNMTSERAHMKDGSAPWYVGWSNCDSAAANILRQHYSRPYFLPEVAESSKTDWIFMGSPGYGAHMHIDNVGNPSWQAQIRGEKTWILEPPPECYHVCPRRVEVTMKPGEIIVLDTNRWFHSTLVIGDEPSICIGSEYD